MKTWRTLRLELLLPAMLAGCSDREGPTADGLPSGPSAAVGGAGIAAPSFLSASASSQTRIDLSWRDNATKESGFELHRSTTGEFGAYSLLATTFANVRVYGDEGLSAGTGYCYRVRALVRTGKSVNYSAFSNSACAVTLVSPPPPPPPIPAAASGTTAVPVNSSEVRVSWIDNSTNEIGFRFQRSFDGGSTWNVLTQLTYGENSTYANLPAVAEQQVCYRVVAFNAGGEAAPSNAGCTTPPAAPTNLTATWSDAQTVTLGWTDNSAVEDGYQVWLLQENCIGFCNAFDPECEYYGQCPQSILVAALPANSTGYISRNQVFGVYRYEFLYVVATRAGGVSNLSNFVAVP